MLEVLAERGLVDLFDEQADHGATPLCVAAQEGHADVIRFLHRHGANVLLSVHGYTPLEIAAELRHAAAVVALCECDARVVHCKGIVSVLQCAIVASWGPAMLELLLGLGVDINADDGSNDGTILCLAASDMDRWMDIDMLEEIRMLLEHGASVSATTYDGYTPLHGAILSCAPGGR